MSTETKRNQLSKTVDLVIPPPRVRMHVDRLAMNRKVEADLKPIRESLLALKKQGATPVPEKPDPKAEVDVKDAYKAAVKEFNSYASEAYQRVVVIYDLCKKLHKITVLNDKQAELSKDDKKLTKKNADELAKEITAARDEPTVVEGEEPVTLGFSEFTAGVNLNQPSEVSALLQRLRDENPMVDLFFQRDAISKTKIRFTDSSIIALATTLQMAISQFAEHAMRTTLDASKKIMYPDHCVSPGLENCSLYPLFSNLPSFKLIVDRQTRKEQWELAYKEHKAKVAKAKKAAKPKKVAKKVGATATKEKAPVDEFHTFEQSEVEEGHAFAQEHEDSKGAKKVTYLWRGIDDLAEEPEEGEEEAEDSTRKFGFNFYIGQVCKNLKDLNKAEDEDYGEVRVSTNIKRFFSNLLVELIHRIAPQIRLLMSYKDAKTVSYEMIITVLKIILIDSYTPNPNGDVELTLEHQKLFDDMDAKVKAYNEHHAAQKTQESDEVEPETEADVEAELEPEVEAEPEPEPEPVAAPVKRSRNAPAAKTVPAAKATPAPAPAKTATPATKAAPASGRRTVAK